MQYNYKAWFPFTLFVICLLTRLAFFGQYIDDWDGVNLAFGLSRDYDVIHDQPHFPGYPVYMFVAWIIYLICHSDVSSLILAGIIFSSFAIFPLYALARRMFSWQTAVLTSALYILNPQIWLQAEKALSDAYGLFFVITFTYFFYRAIEAPSSNDLSDGGKNSKKNNKFGCECESLKWLFLGSLILGLGIGVRISYMAFIIVWGFVTFLVCRKVSIKDGILYSFLGLAMGIIVWTAYLLGRFGIINLYEKFNKHSNYHFKEQSYSILASPDYGERFLTITKNIIAHSFGSWWIDNPLIRLFPTVIMVIAIIVYITNEKMDLKNRFLAVCIGSYVAWLAVVQLAIRQAMVLVPFVLLIISAGVFYFTGKTNKSGKKRKWLLPLILFLLLTPMAFDSGRLAWVNCHEEPPQVAVAKYISENYEKGKTKFYCLNTWRVFQYYAPDWKDKGNNHIFFTSRISNVEQNLKRINPKPENVLISSLLYEKHKYGNRLKKIKVFERDEYAVAEYNWMALYEFDITGL